MPAAAARTMLTAMTRYGRLGERAALVLGWWPDGTDQLVAEARRIGGPHTDDAVAALLQVAAQPV